MATPLGYDSFIKSFLQGIDTNNIVVNFLKNTHFVQIPCCLVFAALVSPFFISNSTPINQNVKGISYHNN